MESKKFEASLVIKDIQKGTHPATVEVGSATLDGLFVLLAEGVTEAMVRVKKDAAEAAEAQGCSDPRAEAKERDTEQEPEDISNEHENPGHLLEFAITSCQGKVALEQLEGTVRRMRKLTTKLESYGLDFEWNFEFLGEREDDWDDDDSEDNTVFVIGHVTILCTEKRARKLARKYDAHVVMGQ